MVDPLVVAPLVVGLMGVVLMVVYSLEVDPLVVVLKEVGL